MILKPRPVTKPQPPFSLLNAACDHPVNISKPKTDKPTNSPSTHQTQPVVTALKASVGQGCSSADTSYALSFSALLWETLGMATTATITSVSCTEVFS